MGKLKIYKSSAGSGKTYTLVQDYLLLALKYPKNFNRILAVTFTNKATAEMKSRILKTTTDIIEKTVNDNLLTKLKEVLSYNDKQLKQASLSLRHEILHNYGQFNISTIDSFFHKIIRSFARDLNIPVNFNISLDYEQVTKDVVNEMFSGINVNESLYNHLKDILHNQINHSKSRNIKLKITDSCKLLHNLPANVIVEMSKYEEVENTIHEFREYAKNIEFAIRDFESKIDKQLAKIDLILDKNIIDTNSFTKNARNIIPKWREKSYDISTTVHNIYEKGQEAWTTKNTPNKHVLNAANEGLHDCFCFIYELLHSFDFSLYNTLKKIAEIIPDYIVFTHIQKQIENYKKNNDLLLNHDIVNFLREIINASGDAPFVYEKTGLFFQHFCIDEFQDTSPTQWNCFVPLLNNALSIENENIIVGDVKQAIYRFRGGDWKLLNSEVEKSFENRFEKHVLEINYRSSKHIVESTGFIFNKFIDSLEISFPKENSNQYSQILKKIYSEVGQDLAPNRKEEKANKGIVQFVSITNDKVKKWKDTAVFLAIKQIEEIQKKGISPGKICLLVRTAKEGEYIMSGIKEYIQNGNSITGCTYKIASQDALYINQALVVQTLTLALSLFNITNIKDAKYIFLCQLISETRQTQASGISRIEINENRLKQIQKDIQSVIPLPFYDALESLIEKWELNTLTDEAAYLNAFMDIVYEFSRNTSGDPKDFLNFWNSSGVDEKLEIPSNQTTIQLMTIHKSKGLQFDYVILPFLNWTLIDSRHNPIMWIKPDSINTSKLTDNQRDMIEIMNKLPHFPIRWSSKGFEKTLFYESYMSECFQMIVENINLLYVAMTRAKEGLFCYFESITSNKRATTVGKIINSILTEADSIIDEVDIDVILCKKYQLGQLEVSNDKDDNSNDADSQLILKYRKSATWQNRIQIRAIDTIQMDTYFGQIIHGLLSQIIYWDDVQPTLKQAFQKGVINDIDYQRCNEIFETIRKNPNIYHIFIPQEDVEVKNEVPIIVGSGNQVRLDRLHINKKTNKAIIYDYKSGKSDTKVALAKYKNQLLGYKSIISEMGYIDVEAFIIHLEKGVKEKIL